MYKLLPLLLLGVTVTTWWNITFSSTEYSSIGNVLLNLGSSFLNIVVEFLPYLLVFGIVLWLWMFIFNKVSWK